MEDVEGVSMFDDGFLDNNSDKANNDPWISNHIESQQYPRLNPVPLDPLRDLINSEQYIESLEKKLHKVKGKVKDNISAKDMLASLQHTKDIQLHHMMAEQSTDVYYAEDAANSDSVMSALQRKINPDKQPINPQELLPLLKQDVLAQVSEQSQSSEDQVNAER